MYQNLIVLNFSVGNVADSLNFSSKQFKHIYNREKPEDDTEIIFSCQKGVRSAKAAVTAEKIGYTKYFFFLQTDFENKNKTKKPFYYFQICILSISA